MGASGHGETNTSDPDAGTDTGGSEASPIDHNTAPSDEHLAQDGGACSHMDAHVYTTHFLIPLKVGDFEIINDSDGRDRLRSWISDTRSDVLPQI